jgi:hypothetical protein
MPQQCKFKRKNANITRQFANLKGNFAIFDMLAKYVPGDTTLCDKICQRLAVGRWFPSSIN